MMDETFEMWSSRDMALLSYLFIIGSFASFQKIVQKFNFPGSHSSGSSCSPILQSQIETAFHHELSFLCFSQFLTATKQSMRRIIEQTQFEAPCLFSFPLNIFFF